MAKETKLWKLSSMFKEEGKNLKLQIVREDKTHEVILRQRRLL